MSGPNPSYNRPTTLDPLLESSLSEIKQQLAYLVNKEQVNQLWKLGIESTLHAIWTQLRSSHVRESVSCQTDEQVEQECAVSCESCSPRNETGQAASEEESCSKQLGTPNAEEQSESKNTVDQAEEESQSATIGGQADIIVIPAGFSLSNENESSTSVVPDEPQEPLNLVNRPRSKEKTSYLCSYCGTQFTLKENLLTHERIHFNQTAFTCQRCSRVLSNRWTLARHEIVCQKRARKLPFECATCGKSYDTKEKYQNHTYSHKEKKHVCFVCDKAFLSPSHLSVHMVAHTGEQPFRCNFCNKQYTTRSSLGVHIRARHSN